MEFRKYTLGELCNTVTDYVANGSFKSLADNVKYKDEKGYARVIRLVDFNNKYSIKDSIWVDEHGYEYLKKSKLFGGEIIITNVGANLGTVFIAPRLNNPMTLGPNAVMLKSNKNDLYLYYWLISPEGRNKIKAIVTGSAMPKFNKTDLKNIELLVPSIDNQDKIVNILGTIDKKIELNNQINDNLFKLAINYLNSKQEETKVPISNFANVQGGYAFKSKDLIDKPTNNRIIKIKNLRTEINVDVVNSQFVEDEVISNLDTKFKLEEGDVTIAMTGAELGKTGFIYGFDKYYLNQRVGVIRGQSKEKELYIKMMFLSDEFQVLLNSKGYGSAQPNISTVDIENILIKDITENNLKDIYEKLNPIYYKIIYNCEENLNLEQLRDTLLPKLINGEIDLDKVEI